MLKEVLDKLGDPLSPYLFIIVLELLLIKIRSDRHIAAFADDLITFVHDKVSLWNTCSVH